MSMKLFMVAYVVAANLFLAAMVYSFDAEWPVYIMVNGGMTLAILPLIRDVFRGENG